MPSQSSRRQFLRQSALLPLVPLAGTGLIPAPRPAQPDPINRNVFGPREGYTPMMSNLVSMLDWMRKTLLQSVRRLSQSQLDAHLDKDANSIGAMLLHLVATERFYQLNTFEGRAWGDWPEADAERYNVAMSLGKPARKAITGHPLRFYLDQLEQVRETTLRELAQRDDAWLLAADDEFVWGPTNNYCKWFHVCEHESNHNGQIKFLKKRVS